jgi:hypothetical protein
MTRYHVSGDITETCCMDDVRGMNFFVLTSRFLISHQRVLQQGPEYQKKKNLLLIRVLHTHLPCNVSIYRFVVSIAVNEAPPDAVSYTSLRHNLFIMP